MAGTPLAVADRPRCEVLSRGEPRRGDRGLRWQVQLSASGGDFFLQFLFLHVE